MMKKTSEKPSFYKLLANIASYVMFPIIMIATLSALVMFVSTPSGKMPQLFGVSIVKILSGSMDDAGFNAGQIVFINQNVSKSALKKQDIVAFFNVSDPADVSVRASLVKWSEWDGVITGENLVIGQRTTKAELEQRKATVYFHYVNEVYVSPADGTLYFQTIGAYSGAHPDGFIRADFVVGQYVNTPLVVRALMGFASTTLGIIFLIVLPLAVLVLMECLGLIEQANAFAYDIKVFNRTIPFDSDEIKKYSIGKDMDLAKKIYFYATAKDAEKERVFDFLYGHLPQGNDKDKKLYQHAEEAKQKLQQSANDYFLFWQSHLTKKSEKKQLKKLQNQYNYVSYFKNINK